MEMEEPKGLRPQRIKRKHRVSYENLNRRKQQELKPFIENHQLEDFKPSQNGKKGENEEPPVKT